MKKIVLLSLIAFTLTSCKNNISGQSTLNQVTVSPTSSPVVSEQSFSSVTPSPSTSSPIQNSIAPSATPALDSVNIQPTSTATSKPTPSTSPPPTNKSGSVTHVAINESIMTLAERNKLNPTQREWISLLDDYEYYFNLQTNKDGIYNDYNYGTIESTKPFGVGIITIQVKVVPLYTETVKSKIDHFDLQAHVEIIHSKKDLTPYYSEDTYFTFVYRNARWNIGLWGI